jgi:hypothetical protein
MRLSFANDELISIDNLSLIRKLLVCDERIIKILSIKILRYYLEINPKVSSIYKSKLIHFLTCKIFDDFKNSSFEERLEVLLYNASLLNSVTPGLRCLILTFLSSSANPSWQQPVVKMNTLRKVRLSLFEYFLCAIQRFFSFNY